MEAWPQRITLAGVAALTLLVATVNARMLLFGAALRPWLGSLPAWQIYPLLQLTTDPGWITSMRYRAEGGNDAAVCLGGALVAAVFLGGALVVWAAWISATLAGFLAGALVADPRRIALDLVLPIFFAAMLVPSRARSPARSRRVSSRTPPMSDLGSFGTFAAILAWAPRAMRCAPAASG